MGKFFKRPPAECSICHEVKDVYKQMQKGITHLSYCKDCYDAVYVRTEVEVKKQIKEMVDKGQKIGMGEALALTKKISEQIEKEQSQALEEKKAADYYKQEHEKITGDENEA